MSQTISAWLKDLELERFASLFIENEIDVATLQVLTDNDLTELGLPFGPRKRILNAISERKRGEHAGERRQLTVLFCDMVGFTDLASRVDPEVLQAILREYEDTCAACITRWEGYVFQRLGDGIVAFFGYPLAQEREAERAILAGLEIIEVLAAREIRPVGKLQVRIGIATGMVVIASAAQGAAGETMNLASRLQNIASPGVIVVSERVRRLAGSAFEYEDLGLQSLKGIARPTYAFRVEGVRTAAQSIESAGGDNRSTLVGRTNDLGTLLEKWEQAQRGNGQVVLLSGEPGIGKSRLLIALRSAVEERGADSLWFRCSIYHTNSAFYPLVDFLERFLGFDRDDSPASKVAKLESLNATDFPSLTKDLPLLASILSIPFEDRYGPLAMTPRRQKAETVRALVDLIEVRARRRPTVLLFEDLHWADPTTLEVLLELVDRVAAMPLLAVMTARPEFQCDWPQKSYVAIRRLTRLDREECLALIVQTSGKKNLPSDLAEEIFERTDGIPLFAEELTKTIIESGDLIDLGDRYDYGGSRADITIPPTLRGALMARLDRLDSAKEVAQIGAVIGREFGYELLEAVAGIPAGQLERSLARLTESGLVTQVGVIPDSVYTFKHALIQDTAYDSLLKSRRQQLHAQLARIIDERFAETRNAKPELLAHHFSAAGLEQDALPLWYRAGELAQARFAMRESASHLRRGLAAVGTLPDGLTRDRYELEFRSLLGPVVLAVRGWGVREVHEILEPAWTLAKSLQSAPKYLPILHTLWVHYLCLGQLSVSLDWAQRLLQNGIATGDDGLTIMGHRAACASHYWMGNFVAARQHGDTLRTLYDPVKHRYIATVTNNDPLTGIGLYLPQYLWMLGYPDQALAAALHKDEHARRLNHPFDLAFALTLGAQVFDYLHEADMLHERAVEAEAIGREHRIPLMSEIMAEIGKGVAALRAGRFAQSAMQLGEAVTRLSATGHKIWLHYLRSLCAEATARAGDLTSASAILSECITHIEAGEDRVHFAEVLRLKGWVLFQLGHAKEAEIYLRRAIQIARGQQAKSWELRAATTLAELLAAGGCITDAYLVLLLTYNCFTEGFATHDLLEAKRILQLLEQRGANNVETPRRN